MNNNNNNNLLLGFIGGIATGAILGVLFAPAKGVDTRKKLADNSSNLKDNFDETINKFATAITDTMNVFKGEAIEIIDQVKEGAVKTENVALKNLKEINSGSLLS